MSWIQTFLGRRVNLTAPRADEISILDVAHHLSRLCRFTGATKRYYSVAEHCIHVSRLVPPEHAFWGLLHDASEAYLGDMATPLKRLLPAYREIEHRFMRVICDRFELAHEEPPIVKLADRALLAAEALALLRDPTGYPLREEAVAAGVDVSGIKIQGWTPDQARDAYLTRYFAIVAETRTSRERGD